MHRALTRPVSHSNLEEIIATVTVRGKLGEPPLVLPVQGRGSSDERYMK